MYTWYKMGFIQGFSEDACIDFAIYSLGFHLIRTIKNKFFCCKCWKPHVSSFIRSGDIAFFLFRPINIKSPFESPSETVLGTYFSPLLIEKVVIVWKISLFFNGVFHSKPCQIDILLWYSSICGIAVFLFDLWFWRSDTDESVRRVCIWPYMAWFHGDLLVWHPSY